MGKRVVVAMSGGVDSSVAAALLKQQGYDVVGVFMQFWFPVGEKYGENRCCSLESWQEARQVAGILEIPIHKVNFGRQFKRQIVDEFLHEYQQGWTPNPCIACNKFIKFELLLKYARTVFKADYLATGHYVAIKNSKLIIKNKKSKRLILARPQDKQKDQTYFLYNLKQEQLRHLLFPLAPYDKKEVRQLAKRFKLPIHDKADSQEICFVGHSHYDFLKRYLKLKPGKIIDDQENALGAHQGLPLYTLGQRSGLGLSGGPWYVSGFDRRKNFLLVTKRQTDSSIYQQELTAVKVNWLLGEPAFPLKCQAQVRYHARPASCQVSKQGKRLKVKFNQKQRAIMPGQSVVFYQGDRLLGGGIIS